MSSDALCPPPPIAHVVLFPSLFYGVARSAKLVDYILIENVDMVIVVRIHLVLARRGIYAQAVVPPRVDGRVVLVIARVRSVDKIEPFLGHANIRVGPAQYEFVTAQKPRELTQKPAERLVDVLLARKLLYRNGGVEIRRLAVVGRIARTAAVARRQNRHARNRRDERRRYTALCSH